jgi:hypothetical protein
MKFQPVLLAVGVLLVAGSMTSASAQARRRGGDRPSGGTESAPRPEPAPTAVPAPAGRRRAPGSESPSPPPDTQGDRAVARPQGGRPAEGVAVPRGSVPAPPRVTTTFAPVGYYGSFWPWGYAGLGFGSYYVYDPFYTGYAPVAAGRAVEGAIRLKITPRDAQVYVDGYYVGTVDEFDGIFQRLHLEAGPHHVEVQAEGYEPLTVNVLIQPDHTITYEGELRRAP